MSYERFVSGFQHKVREEGDSFLLELLNGLYTDDVELNGQIYTIRRMTDEVLDPESQTVKTGFFCFPQDPGDKNKMQHGGFVYIHSRCTDMDGMQLTFSNPENVTFTAPDRYQIYHAVVANRARKQLVLEGTNNFLFHDIYITTPEKETYHLDQFDFTKHELFMLGLIGREYQIHIQQRT